MRILFLPSWYPNQKSPYDGNFVQNHARAVSLYHEIVVLFCTSLVQQEKKYVLETKVDSNVKEIRVYFKYHKFFLIRFIRKLWAYRKGYKAVGNYDLIHTHVFFWIAFLGMFLSLWNRKKLVHTEHSSEFRKLSGIKKTLIKLFKSRVGLWFPVSQCLKNELMELGIENSSIRVIPNAIDANSFEIHPTLNDNTIRFLHISNYRNPIKNLKGILTAFEEISLKYSNYILEIAGEDELDWLKEECKKYRIPKENLVLSNSFTPSELVQKYASSDAIILFSHFETFGMVLAESLLCGRPVIASSVGGVIDFVHDENGILVPSDDIENLIHAIEQFLQRKKKWNPEGLRETIINYVSFPAVGRRYAEAYESLVSDSLA